MNVVLVVAGLGLREAVRRRVLPVVLGLSVVFLGLVWLAVGVVRDEQDSWDLRPIGERVPSSPPPLDDETAGLLLGMASFTTLFLGATLAIFLTAGAVRGDVERGLLQPLVVRPLGRARVLAGRWLAATAMAVPYTLAFEAAVIAILHVRGGYDAPSIVVPALELSLAVGLVALLSLAASTVLSQVAAGIGAFMALGAGLAGGLVGQIADELDSGSLGTAADVVSTALPFQGLYQDALSRLTPSDGALIALGPLGGGDPAPGWFAAWVAVWVALVAALGFRALLRRDL